ncbi:hypothetical protein BDY21DRAFT_342954 [Lineolata rhizophorae]|uniref:Uncharacterized protein n=1 Tax=Lineolata rhizophorae TaxID=578093 RepID=A0A6A6P1S6_9PEZI|nr:hypothetical protein BDY21DRAFT_342954 [Lineolata rhizophorae]
MVAAGNGDASCARFCPRQRSYEEFYDSERRCRDPGGVRTVLLSPRTELSAGREGRMVGAAVVVDRGPGLEAISARTRGLPWMVRCSSEIARGGAPSRRGQPVQTQRWCVAEGREDKRAWPAGLRAAAKRNDAVEGQARRCRRSVLRRERS